AWVGGDWYNLDSASFLGFDSAGHDGNREDGLGVCRFSPLVDWDADGRNSLDRGGATDRAVIDAGLNYHAPINEFLGNEQYLARSGAPETVAQNLMRFGEFTMPSDYAHSYSSRPLTAMDF